MGSGINAAKGHNHWLSVWLHIACWADLSWLWWGIRRRKEMEQLRMGRGVDQLNLILPSHISNFLNLTSSVSLSEANWLWTWYTQTNTQAIWWEAIKGAVDQVWAGKEKQTAMDKELHVQTHKCRPDLLLPIFFLLLGKRWDSTWAFA